MRPSTVVSLVGFVVALVTEIVFGRAPGGASSAQPR